jgi:pimeloyl-ACP methyl ester carboxylesterase
LIRAEHLGRYSDDVYLVKHNTDQDKTVEVAVSHLSPGFRSKRPQRGALQPVILVHGAFQNRNQWLGMQGEGLAGWLVEQGLDVWLMEMRGHGFSPRNRDYQNNTAEACACYDIPAVNAFVLEQTGRKPVWIGHSLGGVAVATAVAAEQLRVDNCAGLALLGTQVLKRPWYLWLPLSGVSLRTMMKLKGELDGQKTAMGPENEPVGVVNEYLRRQGLFGKWQLREKKRLLLPGWRRARLPLLMVSGEADELAPAASCQRFFDLYGSLLASAEEAVASALEMAEIAVQPSLAISAGAAVDSSGEPSAPLFETSENVSDSASLDSVSEDITEIVEERPSTVNDNINDFTGINSVDGFGSGTLEPNLPVTGDDDIPEREHLILAVTHGFTQDYNSLDMVNGQAAETEVWPRLLGWLQERR